MCPLVLTGISSPSPLLLLGGSGMCVVAFRRQPSPSSSITMSSGLVQIIASSSGGSCHPQVEQNLKEDVANQPLHFSHGAALPQSGFAIVRGPVGL